MAEAGTVSNNVIIKISIYLFIYRIVILSELQTKLKVPIVAKS